MSSIDTILAIKKVPYYVRPLIWRHIGRPYPIEISITAGYKLLKRWENECIEMQLSYTDEESPVEYASQHGLKLVHMLSKDDAYRFINVMIHNIHLLLHPTTIQQRNEGNKLFYNKYLGKKTSRALHAVDGLLLNEVILRSHIYRETRYTMKKRLEFYIRGLKSARAVLTMNEEQLEYVGYDHIVKCR